MKALITGITGQDGSYLAEFLLAKGYEVHGIIRRSSQFNTQRIRHIYKEPWEPGCKLFLHHGDVTDFARMNELIQFIKPDEVYHLAAQSHVAVSFDAPAYSVDTVVQGTLNMLMATNTLSQNQPVKFYNAASSEMFGNSPPPQNEKTPFNPRSPYGCAKVYGYFQTINYREAGLFACNGILFNHESPRRGETFVTRKITRAATRIQYGLQEELRLGDIQTYRDWGYAGDYVEAMWLMLQQDKPDDYVIGTGESHSVEEFLQIVFKQLCLRVEDHVKTNDPRLGRITDVMNLRADYSKAREILDWKPTVTFNLLAMRMVVADIKLAIKEAEER